jgi:F0F1-type ATP synthase membrane subunit b/b'
VEFKLEHHLDLTSAVLIPYFNFAVFLAAAVYLFRKPLAAMAQSKRDNYLKASKAAAAALEEAKNTFAETKSRFDALEDELRSFAAQSEKAAHEESKRLLEDAEKFVRHLRDETSRLAVDAIDRARRELRHEIVLAAKQQAEEKIQKELDSSSKDKILKSKISETSHMTLPQ